VSSENLKLCRPSRLKRVLERARVREVVPGDICPTREDLDKLIRRYPDLAGDKEIGPGDDGNCQSWRGDGGWWRRVVS
jgi:hypothetical protein